MKAVSVPYSSDHEPPAPVVPVALRSPVSEDTIVVRALIDSGADVSVVPSAVADVLDLPVVATTKVGGIVGEVEAPVHAVELTISDTTLLVRVVGLGDEVLVGRDVLARFVVTLDGLRRRTTVLARKRRTRSG